MNTKKILLSLLAGVVGATVMGVSAMAEDFSIGSAQELTEYAALVNGGADTSDDVVTLTADIDLEDVEWTPIGTGARNSASYSGNAFKGTFDGNGKTISNLTIEDSQSGDAVCGFFGTVSAGTVKNLKFVKANVTSNATNTAIAVGLACDGATISGITVGTKNDNSVVNCPDGAAGVLGRLVGSGTVIDCTNYADVNSEATNGGVGGVIGKAYRPDSADSMEVVNCVNYGDIECGYASGGIVGLSATNVIDCENYGTVTAGAEAGGIVGEQNNPTTGPLYITGNKNKGEVIVNNPEKFGAGGIIGQAKTQATNPAVILYINDNENSGDILVEGTTTDANATDAGGIVGYLYQTDAIVSGNANYAENIVAAGYAGGIVGLVYQHTDGTVYGDDVTITNNVNSTEGVSGVGSSNSANHEITNNDAAEWCAIVIAADGTETKYASLASAVDNAVAGETVKLLADTEVDATVVIDKNITIDGDGYTIQGIDGENGVSNGVVALRITNAEVTLEDVVVKGGSLRAEDGTLASTHSAAPAIIIENATLNVENSEIYGGDMEANGGSAEYAIDATASDIVITNSHIENGEATSEGYGAVCIGVIILDDTTKLEISDSTVVANVGTPASVAGVIIERNIGDEDLGSSDNDITLYGEMTFLGATFENMNIVTPEGETLTLKGSISDDYIADVITVKYVKKDVENNEDTDEQADLYDIVLEGNKDFINRLNSADLTFKLTADFAMSYEIIASNPEVVINPVNNSADRYEFHFDGKDDVTDTAKEIVIGQVKISGYGTYNFVIDAEAKDEADDKTNVVYATEAADSIVDTFIPGGAAEGNSELVIDAAIDAYIAVPTRDLTINVDFPNAVVDRVIAYNDMAVKVSGGDLAEEIVIALGNDAVKTVIGNNDNKKEAYYEAKFENGAYTVTLANILTVNNSYNVTVEGAGYRTARYTVTMNCDDSKTLNFWNNVKDNAFNVEEGKDSSAKTITYLAGDIVKDGVINVYDLSAVVSYFGEVELSETNNKTYAKYDLNRDGKIDSKDVAYVLVSWGK